MLDDSFYMKIAFNEAKKAFKKGEIPVGALIVSLKNGSIISKAHNLRDNSQIVTRHAEIIAIEKANKILKNWRLNDCVLYTTLKPCDMCFATIKSAKINKVIYAADSFNDNNTQNINIVQIECESIKDDCSKIIQQQFNILRKK